MTLNIASFPSITLATTTWCCRSAPTAVIIIIPLKHSTSTAAAGAADNHHCYCCAVSAAFSYVPAPMPLCMMLLNYCCLKLHHFELLVIATWHGTSCTYIWYNHPSWHRYSYVALAGTWYPYSYDIDWLVQYEHALPVTAVAFTIVALY